MTQTPTTKCCPRCGVEYPATLEYFPPYKKNLDGLHYWCRVCTRAAKREWQKKADPEKRRRMAREYYQKNREKLCEQQRKKRAENAEAARKRDREYYQKNREWLLEKERERRGSKKIDDDDYSDLYPLDERSFGFRSWAAITSAEYAKELTAWQIADMMEEETENLK